MKQPDKMTSVFAKDNPPQSCGPDGSFLADVMTGLGSCHKSLPAKYFYDATGSKLFEAICALEEYYPTRTEIGILETYADEMAAATSFFDREPGLLIAGPSQPSLVGDQVHFQAVKLADLSARNDSPRSDGFGVEPIGKGKHQMFVLAVRFVDQNQVEEVAN